MSNWVSAHEPLYNALFNHLLQSPLKARVTGIYDGMKMDLVKPYAIVGETGVIESESSTGMHEDIAVQMHIYADSKPECRELMRLMKYYAKQKPFTLDGCEITKVRLSNEQVMNDIDNKTSHGVLRIVYTVRHKLLFERMS